MSGWERQNFHYNGCNMIFLYTSPFGSVSYACDGRICRQIWLRRLPEAKATHHDPVSDWLDGYFSGKIGPLPAVAEAKTPFQARLRAGLLDIPFGEIRTYGELAGKLGSGARAVGQALGANPLPVLVPCHRIVAANGPGGFSCGIEWKKRLLAFERSL